MVLRLSARIASFLVLSFFAAGCDPLSDDETVTNVATQPLSGCDALAIGSCNQAVLSGPAAKVVQDEGAAELSIRLVMVNGNGDLTYTCDDGETEIVLQQFSANTFEGTIAKASFASADVGSQAATLADGTKDTILEGDPIAGIGGTRCRRDGVAQRPAPVRNSAIPPCAIMWWPP